MIGTKIFNLFITTLLSMIFPFLIFLHAEQGSYWWVVASLIVWVLIMSVVWARTKELNEIFKVLEE